jgi:eukaryotic-like serine/threonine-protein kinase
VKPDSPVDKTVVATGEPPPKIGGYSIVRLIGHGGAGRVFAARDDQLGRTVAIKVLHPEVAQDPQNVERFLREARSMATISSPHVAAVYQVGQHQGATFIVMEYLEGENLEQRLKRERRVPLREALAFARDCARALEAADAAGLVHRDVKPANIVVLAGRAKLTDFGTARRLDGSADMTLEGQIAGTATFMAPERAMGQGDDRRADIYSLGATLYCLIDGQPPFVRDNPLDVIAAHLHEQPTPLHERVAGVGVGVTGLVARMMAKEPAARFQRYDELIAAFETLLAREAAAGAGEFDEPTEAFGAESATLPPSPPPPRAPPRPRASPPAAATPCS